MRPTTFTCTPGSADSPNGGGAAGPRGRAGHAGTGWLAPASSAATLSRSSICPRASGHHPLGASLTSMLTGAAAGFAAGRPKLRPSSRLRRRVDRQSGVAHARTRRRSSESTRPNRRTAEQPKSRPHALGRPPVPIAKALKAAIAAMIVRRESTSEPGRRPAQVRSSSMNAQLAVGARRWPSPRSVVSCRLHRAALLCDEEP